MKIRKINNIPPCAGRYILYQRIPDNKLLFTYIYFDDDNINHWDETLCELFKENAWEYWGDCNEHPIFVSSCYECPYSIWTSHFKYCKQLEFELNNWFRINAQLKDCPFRSNEE